MIKVSLTIENITLVKLIISKMEINVQKELQTILK